MEATQLLAVERIGLSPAEQCRVKELDRRYVNELTEALAHVPVEQWPALLVTPWGEDAPDMYACLGGWHRLHAAQALGIEAVPCRIIAAGDFEDAFADNLRNGLRLTAEDRREHAYRLAEKYPDMSGREIARRCGVSHTTVQRWFADDDDTEREASGDSASDPVTRQVRAIVRLHRTGAGRGFLGRDTSAKAVRQAIEQYDDDDRAEAAQALAAWGRAFTEAATAYL